MHNWCRWSMAASCPPVHNPLSHWINIVKRRAPWALEGFQQELKQEGTHLPSPSSCILLYSVQYIYSLCQRYERNMLLFQQHKLNMRIISFKRASNIVQKWAWMIIVHLPAALYFNIHRLMFLILDSEKKDSWGKNIHNVTSGKLSGRL